MPHCDQCVPDDVSLHTPRNDEVYPLTHTHTHKYKGTRAHSISKILEFNKIDTCRLKLTRLKCVFDKPFPIFFINYTCNSNSYPHIPHPYQQAIVFPRIAIKTNPGTLIVRETEKVLGEKITTRTEEVPCPVTGVPHLRTVEVVEKLIETEVVNTLAYTHTHYTRE